MGPRRHPPAGSRTRRIRTLNDDDDHPAGPATDHRTSWWDTDTAVPPPPDRPALSRRAATARAITVLAWTAAAGLTVIELNRLVDRPFGVITVGLQVLAPLVAFPAFVLLLIAAVLRRRLLALACVALTAVGAVWLVPELTGGGPQTPAAGSVPLRIFSANVEYTNGDTSGIAAEIRRADPDVVVILELSPTSEAGLRTVLAGYRQSYTVSDRGAFGAGIWTRGTLADVQVPYVGDLPQLNAQVTVQGHSFRLWAVHTVSPTQGDYVRRWKEQLGQLRTDAREMARANEPVIFAGDFNATEDHAPLRQLLDSGVRDVHDVVNGGWAPTWSRKLPVPPFARIDHILVGNGIQAVSERTGTGTGSDHRPLIADLALR